VADVKRAIAITLIVTALLFAGVYGGLVFGVRYIVRKVSSATPLLPITSSHVVQNVTYCSPEAQPQKLDLYMPDAAGRSYPLLVYVHGGSWISGSKDTEMLKQYLPSLADTGFVVAAINYRLVPDYTFPAQVDDVKCAIRFLRAHRATYQINPQHVGVIGESAGGYLAAFAGATGDSAGYRTNEHSQESDRVQAVVDIAGPSDFTAAPATVSAGQIVKEFLGGADPASASVLPYISADDPPYLILHGKEDTTVPIAQSESLYAKLMQAHVEANLIAVDNTSHSLTGTALQTQSGKFAADIISFFRQKFSQ
jgi:acetyl esterase/lipase